VADGFGKNTELFKLGKNSPLSGEKTIRIITEKKSFKRPPAS
jgi:hypothetical protein